MYLHNYPQLFQNFSIKFTDYYYEMHQNFHVNVFHILLFLFLIFKTLFFLSIAQFIIIYQGLSTLRNNLGYLKTYGIL